MIYTHNTSLEEMPIGSDGHVQLPVICDACYHAMNPERGCRSTSKSYARLAECEYTFTVQDWHGLSTETCRCCGSRAYQSRFTVTLRRKERR